MSYSFKSTAAIRQSRKIAAIMAALATVLMIFGSPAKCLAGIPVGEKPPGMSDAQFYQMAVDAAEKDLERKKAVGQRRFDQRMAYRESLINGMKSQLEVRRRIIDVAPTPAASTGAKDKSDFLGYAIWGVAIAVSLMAAWQFYRSRQQGALAEA